MKKLFILFLFLAFLFSCTSISQLKSSKPWSHKTDTWTYKGVTFPKMSEGMFQGKFSLDYFTVMEVYRRNSDGKIFAYLYSIYEGWHSLKERYEFGKRSFLEDGFLILRGRQLDIFPEEGIKRRFGVEAGLEGNAQYRVLPILGSDEQFLGLLDPIPVDEIEKILIQFRIDDIG